MASQKAQSLGGGPTYGGPIGRNCQGQCKEQIVSWGGAGGEVLKTKSGQIVALGTFYSVLKGSDISSV